MVGDREDMTGVDSAPGAVTLVRGPLGVTEIGRRGGGGGGRGGGRGGRGSRGGRGGGRWRGRGRRGFGPAVIYTDYPEYEINAGPVYFEEDDEETGGKKYLVARVTGW